MKNSISTASFFGFGLLILGGCDTSVKAPSIADLSNLPNSFTYESTTDKFEGITTSSASQWYPDIADPRGELFVSFMCIGKPSDRTLTLVIQNLPVTTDQTNDYNPSEFTTVRAKFDNREPFQIFRTEYNEMPDQLQIGFSNYLAKGNLDNIKTMSLRMFNETFTKTTKEFTVDINIKNDAIQRVVKDCRMSSSDALVVP